MGILDLIYLFLYMLAALGILAVCSFPFVWLFLWRKKRKLVKKIPDKIRKEVENGRSFKENIRKEAGERYRREDEFRTYGNTKTNSTNEYERRNIGAGEYHLVREGSGNGNTDKDNIGTGSSEERRDIQILPTESDDASKRKPKEDWPEFE